MIKKKVSAPSLMRACLISYFHRPFKIGCIITLALGRKNSSSNMAAGGLPAW